MLTHQYPVTLLLYLVSSTGSTGCGLAVSLNSMMAIRGPTENISQALFVHPRSSSTNISEYIFMVTRNDISSVSHIRIIIYSSSKPKPFFDFVREMNLRCIFRNGT
ncbi:hypothetical protein C8J55DRAFT_527115 [Lentinula edodes]|uniref:Uncharacterized protein n=1 Tax=Lentinula lateritia TaxID=40482 RepID=A0A9W8ZT73_9AGAR|nr:hypothetical protein C8J55DRAFT_527115 [Lentinula edodes]